MKPKFSAGQLIIVTDDVDPTVFMVVDTFSRGPAWKPDYHLLVKDRIVESPVYYVDSICELLSTRCT